MSEKEFLFDGVESWDDVNKVLEEDREEVFKRFAKSKLIVGDLDDEVDNVNHPSHYQGKYECIDVMVELFGPKAVAAFCKCNIFKYRFRSDKKNGEEDIKKAEWYEEKLMELNSIYKLK